MNGEPKTFTRKPDPTPEPQPQTSSTLVPTSTPTTSDDAPPEVSCVAPTNRVADKARPLITTESLGCTYTPAPDGTCDTEANPLLFLPLNLPDALGNCGGGVEGRYFSGGFYQNGDTFARTDGINAINQFCAAHHKNGSVLGPDGAMSSDKTGWSGQKAQVRDLARLFSWTLALI